mmetsp:Transcript_132108/g.229015  ORF Transcript_132108/g.229015 Transcript_132108/m.229015 type:complete len:124 (-) Transcript_132108:266-637(-)
MTATPCMRLEQSCDLSIPGTKSHYRILYGNQWGCWFNGVIIRPAAPPALENCCILSIYLGVIHHHLSLLKGHLHPMHCDCWMYKKIQHYQCSVPTLPGPSPTPICGMSMKGRSGGTMHVAPKG